MLCLFRIQHSGSVDMHQVLIRTQRMSVCEVEGLCVRVCMDGEVVRRSCWLYVDVV